jgi:hypothetical protein
MYSRGDIAVDKGLGFDFSAIADLVKSALPVGLNIYSKQMELKQVKALSSGGFVQQPGTYGQGYGQLLPFSTAMQSQPTFGGQYMQPSSGIGTGTMLAIGATAVVGLLAFKLMR